MDMGARVPRHCFRGGDLSPTPFPVLKILYENSHKLVNNEHYVWRNKKFDGIKIE